MSFWTKLEIGIIPETISELFNESFENQVTNLVNILTWMFLLIRILPRKEFEVKNCACKSFVRNLIYFEDIQNMLIISQLKYSYISSIISVYFAAG